MLEALASNLHHKIKKGGKNVASEPLQKLLEGMFCPKLGLRGAGWASICGGPPASWETKVKEKMTPLSLSRAGSQIFHLESSNLSYSAALTCRRLKKCKWNLFLVLSHRSLECIPRLISPFVPCRVELDPPKIWCLCASVSVARVTMRLS